jgi:membrane peptidoglycan carboxypeptidase
LRAVGFGALAVCGLAYLLLGIGLVPTAEAAVSLGVGLPDVARIEQIFADPLQDGYPSIQILDRSGNQILLEAMHPASAERRWVRADASALQRGQLPFLLAGLDLAEAEPASVTPALGGAWLRRLAGIRGPSPLAQYLASANLVPLQDVQLPQWMQQLRRDYLASALERDYTQQQLVEWYLNSAYYGNLAYGIDAAALVYFGRHASELDLAESAILTAIPMRPEENPIDSPIAALRNGEETLQRWEALGRITPQQHEAAALADKRIQGVAVRDALQAPDIAWFALGELQERWGLRGVQRGGLRVQTTADADLQSQVECVLETQRGRLNGEPPSFVTAAAKNQACIGAGLLPPMRPSDVEADHNIGAAGAVVLDPNQGEILALAGDVGLRHSTRRIQEPFVYLAALIGGDTPATMVLDLPVEGLSTAAESYGPVRLRTALGSGLRGATEWVHRRVGADRIQRTFESFELESKVLPDAPQQTLLSVAQAYGVLAAEGRLTGVVASGASSETATLRPTSMGSVYDPAVGVRLYEPREERAILGSSLAYLLNHMLSDESARSLAFGPSSPLEIDRPAAVVADVSDDGRSAMTIGYTPQHLVAVWMGADPGERMVLVNALNAATPAWHALMRYSHGALARETWTAPPDVIELEVCDPSGMLPTEYCPQVATEVFLQGTEPTHYDTLYQPFTINRETGKLATLFTPARLVEQRVYMVPPPEAAEWAAEVGLPRPPTEYDSLVELGPVVDDVQIDWPVPFSYLAGDVTVRGTASPDDMSYYRLQFGQGLNPATWVQIGDDSETPVRDGVLGTWDTSAQTGLVTLQLIVVGRDGTLRAVSVPLTLDNTAPQISVLAPAAGEALAAGSAVLIEADIQEEIGIDSVSFWIDDQLLASLDAPPFAAHYEDGAMGEHVLVVRARDLAGNESESAPVQFSIAP